MRTAGAEETFDEISSATRTHLRECALLLIGAMSESGSLPADTDDIADLIGRTAEPEPGPREAPRFATESPDELPRFSGHDTVWVTAAGQNALRLRAEEGVFLTSTSVVLHGDGRLGGFTAEKGFGVPDSELTDQARRDLESVGRRRRMLETEDDQSQRSDELDYRRYGAEHLVTVAIAPRQDPSGLIVTWIAIYHSGVIVNYLVPRPQEDDQAGEAALSMAARPTLELHDSIGTKYEPVGFGNEDLRGSMLRGSVEFAPGAPDAASHLIVRSAWGAVEIDS